MKNHIRNTVIQIANDFLQRKANMNLWLEIVADYCTTNKKEKGIQIFPQLPQSTQAQIIKYLIDYYSKEYNISSVGIIDNSMGNVIINGIQQSNYKPFNYF